MRARLIFDGVLAAGACAVGLAWSLPAAAVGITLGLVLAFAADGLVTRLTAFGIEETLRPAAPHDDREDRRLPSGAGTVWLMAVAGVCGGVSYGVEHGVLGDVTGYAFLPLIVPWVVLTLTLSTRLALRRDGSGNPTLDAGFPFDT